MKKCLIAMVMSIALSSWAGKVEYKEAKLVDTSKESMEATVVKSIEALARSDEQAYLSLCSEEYIKKLNELNGAPIKARMKSGKKFDLEKKFLYAVSKFDEINKVWTIRIKIHNKVSGNTTNRFCKIAMIDDKYKVIDD